jgi:hypothetical protein
MYSGAEISLGIGGLEIASYSFRIADHSPRSVVSTAHQSMANPDWSCTVCPLHSDFSNRNREGQSDKQRVWGTR